MVRTPEVMMYVQVMHSDSEENPRGRVDHELTRLAATGDPSAERQLLERVLPRIQKTCRCLCCHPGEAEDFIQLALIEVIRSVGSFREESSLDYWVDRIAVQTVAKEIQRRSRRRRINEAIWQPGPVVKPVDETAALSRVRDRLSVHVGDLSPKYRAAVVMHYLYEYEVSEIAEITGANINTIRGRLRRGLRNIRRSILADPVLQEWIEAKMK